MRKIAAFALGMCLALPAFAARPRVELVTTDNATLMPGGVVTIRESSGDLNITGWDRSTVEVITTRYTFPNVNKKDRSAERLKRVQVTTQEGEGGALTISTTNAKLRGVLLNYRIMVPHSARLVIQHHTGQVYVRNVEGGIDAKAGKGDIFVQLPAGHYAIDAKCRLGGIYADNTSGAHNWLGEKLREEISAQGATAEPAHRIDLRLGVGGITIQRADV